MAKKQEKEKPDSNMAVVNMLILVLLEIKRTNKILRITELNNRQRHEELLAAIGNSRDATKVTYTKVRREPIT